MSTSAPYLEKLFGLAGKRAVVTGGATGIGRMIAAGLVAAGADVLIASRKGKDCEAAAAGMDGPGRATGCACDLSSEAGLAAFAAEVRDRSPRLDILVNNAGVTWGEPYETFPYRAWEKVQAVNVAAPFTLTRDLTALLAESATDGDPARVINIGSVMGSQPVAEWSYSYAASKAALHHLTRILAGELAARRITCNALAPGIFPSRMTAFATGDDATAARMAKLVPLGRLGAPGDAAGAVLYLCAPAGSWVTGAILPVDGGLSAQTPVRMFVRD